MKLEAKDFPLYEYLLTLNNPGVQLAKNDFITAQENESDNEKLFNFALGIYTLTHPSCILPGSTPEMVNKTRESCKKVFEYVGVEIND